VSRAKRRFVVREALGLQPTEGAMRRLRKSWLPFFIFAVGAILNVGNEQSAKAFTLIERALLPAVQLIANQLADIKVTNVSGNPINVIITTFRDNGTVVAQERQSIAAGTTFTHVVHAPVNFPLSFHATIESDTANAAVSDVMTLDLQTGEVTAILPFVKFDTK
jgi:hypothetical protein